MSYGPTKEIADFAANLDYDDIPESVLKSIKLYLLDTLGCGFFGSTDRRSSILAEALLSLETAGRTIVWNSTRRGSVGTASLLNGSFVHALDFDDQCMEVGLHAGSCVVPPTLGFSENDRNINGKTFLTALVVGYETSIRIGSAFGLEPVKRGWHIAGFNGVFGSAMSVGKLIGLDVKGMENAMGLSATQGAGLMSVQYGSDAKSMHSGKAAQAGLYSAQLASRGYRGIEDVLELEYGGYYSTLSDKYDPQKTVENLGDKYLINEKLALKAYPGVRMVHAPVEAVELILEENNLGLDDVEHVHVYVTRIAKDHVGWKYEPKGITSALSNIQFGVAAILVNKRLHVGSYSEESIRDPRILRVTGMVEVNVDKELDHEAPNSMGSSVRVKLKGGGYVEKSIVDPKGAPITRPLSRNQVIAKFKSLISDEQRADEIISFVEKIEQEENAGSLAKLLVATSS